jgi:hypothetical protein
MQFCRKSEEFKKAQIEIQAVAKIQYPIKSQQLIWQKSSHRSEFPINTRQKSTIGTNG